MPADVSCFFMIVPFSLGANQEQEPLEQDALPCPETRPHLISLAIYTSTLVVEGTSLRGGCTSPQRLNAF